MPKSILKLGVAKLGCVGVAPLSDLILDERADREDLTVRAFTSGAKLDAASCAATIDDLVAFQPDLALLVSPNAALPGPTAARQTLHQSAIPTISLSDGPARKVFFHKDPEGKQIVNTDNVPAGQGFIVFPGDPMLGARREFLDPTEMALYNADLLKVLSVGGVIRLIQLEVDRVLLELGEGADASLPAFSATIERALAAAEFANPYAGAKARAALTIAEAVAGVTAKACFVEKDPARYVPMVAAAHEMMRSAAQLADQAREIEKQNDTLLRTPHAADGTVKRTTRLLDKPT